MTKSRHNMAHHIAARDSSVDIRDNDLGSIVPQIDLSRHFLFALEPTFDCKRDGVISRFKVKRFEL